MGKGRRSYGCVKLEIIKFSLDPKVSSYNPRSQGFLLENPLKFGYNSMKNSELSASLRFCPKYLPSKPSWSLWENFERENREDLREISNFIDKFFPQIAPQTSLTQIF